MKRMNIQNARLKALVDKYYNNPLGRDVIISFIARGLTTFFNLLLLPLSLKILTINDYGVWLTVSSLNAWVSLFDFGTQNTLRNKLAADTATDTDAEKRNRGLILTNSFAFTLVISCVFLLISLVLYFSCNFTALLKVQNAGNNNVNALVAICLVIFGVKLFSNNYNAVLIALQKAYITLIMSLSSSFLALVILFVSMYMHVHVSLLQYAVVILFTDLLLSIVLPVIYLRSIGYKFNIKIEYLSLKFFRSNLLNSNLKFFALSLLVVITFFSTNFFIGIMLSYADVTVYNLVNKYFYVITILSVVILNPVWTKISVLYSVNDIGAIKKLIQKTYLLFGGLTVFGLVLLIFDHLFYRTFSNGTINPQRIVSIVALLSMLQLLFNNIYAYVLNAMSLVTAQIIGFIIAAIIIYPCYYFFCNHLKMGVLGAFWVQIIVYIPNSLIFPFVVYRKLKAMQA